MISNILCPSHVIIHNGYRDLAKSCRISRLKTNSNCGSLMSTKRFQVRNKNANIFSKNEQMHYHMRIRYSDAKFDEGFIISDEHRLCTISQNKVGLNGLTDFRSDCYRAASLINTGGPNIDQHFSKTFSYGFSWKSLYLSLTRPDVSIKSVSNELEITCHVLASYIYITPSWSPGAARQHTRELMSTTHAYPWLIP